METGAAEGESREAKVKRRTEGTTAGGERETGKSEGRELSSQKGSEADERTLRGPEKAEKMGT
ncbi:MAG: hypothetical protein IJ422_05135 [Oscillospiraceae bacterium]|nr:hypothetical protein [Oscillospiraceae bacterium]